MDTSTIIFVLTLAVAFVFLRWLITPIPPSIPGEPRVGVRRNNNNRVQRRQVSDSMIEVVQAIAPQLTPAQIRYDLERSGSVEATIERFMESGTLPMPPGQTTTAEVEENHNVAPKESDTNLIEKYGLSQKVNGDLDQSESKWGTSKEERTDILHKRREEMILKARKRLASQLSNEVENDPLTS